MSSFTHAIGSIFQPLLKFVAEVLAFLYSIVPSYPVAVTLLTILIMALVTPLTVKSTKNMAAMQALAPEMKKLQQKYKGAENRAQLNEEMMRLYKEHKVNPASGCLPMLLQMPAFLVLYDVIRGITNTVGRGATLPYAVTASGIDPTTTSKCTSAVCADPRYISPSTTMYHDIVAAHGRLMSGGMDFANKLLGHHSSVWVAAPFLVLVLAAVGLQYLQMARLNARNPQAASANPQAAALQKYMPLIFGFIYLNVAAILNVYFIVSSAIRILTQEILFRRGIVPGPGAPPPAGGSKRSGVDKVERPVPGSATKGTGKDRDGGAKGGARAGEQRTGADESTPDATEVGGSDRNGASPGSVNGKGAADANGSAGKKSPHPRAKGKRERKAR